MTHCIEYLPGVQRVTLFHDGEAVPAAAAALIEHTFAAGPPAASVHAGIQVQTYPGAVPRPAARLPALAVPLPASALDGLRSLGCRHCGTPLMQPARLTVKDLPSTYWSELIDCWSCHQSEFAGLTNRLRVAAGHDLLLPAPGVLHVALDSLVLSAGDAAAPSPHCPGCGAEVGALIEDGAYLRLHKHAVTATLADGSVLRPPSPVDLLLVRLHELMEAHGSFSFHVVGPGGALWLRLVNWTLLVLTPAGLRPTLKVAVGAEPLDGAEPVPVDQATLDGLLARIAAAWPPLQLPGSAMRLVNLSLDEGPVL